MSDVALSDNFSFAGALAAAAGESVSFAESSAQDEGGSSWDDGSGAGGIGGTVLLVGAVGLVGLGIAVLADGGSSGDSDLGTPANRAPTITSGGTATVEENADVSTVVYQVVATDPDGDPLTYSLGGPDAAAFQISSTGAVTLREPADFENKSSYNFDVIVSDGSLSATQSVTLTVTDLPDGPGEPTVVSLDVVGEDGEAVIIDASNGSFRFTDDANVDSNVIIINFGEDDIIEVTNATSAQYSFGTAAGDPTTLQLVYRPAGADNIILLEDILPDGAGVIFNEARAEAEVGYNFINFA